MPVPGRRERVALNETRFRDINDQLRSELAQLSAPLERIHFVCECGVLECREQVELTVADYESIRADPMLFAVIPGHEILKVEDVVGRGDDFLVVRKHDDVAPVVRATDPRR